MSRTNPSVGITALRGVTVGLAATQALDWLSIVLYEREDLATRIAEDSARGYLHAYEVATARLADRLGVALSGEELRRWGWGLHRAFGVAGGVGYVLLRRRFPKVGVAWGLAFGAAFFAAADEVLVPLFALTPGPRAFPWKVHARGALSHLAYGVAAETASRALDRWWPRSR